MHFRTDLEVIMYGSSGVRRSLFVLFLLSLLADVEMLLPKSAFSHAAILLTPWAAGAHFLVCAIGVVALIGAALLWLVMVYLCLHDPERPIFLRVLWGLVFVFTIWLGAQLFYLFPFRQSLKRAEKP
ncbi:MAG: hypothetical protein WAK26_03275 [Terracidiphilus sp.]